MIHVFQLSLSVASIHARELKWRDCEQCFVRSCRIKITGSEIYYYGARQIELPTCRYVSLLQQLNFL